MKLFSERSFFFGLLLISWVSKVSAVVCEDYADCSSCTKQLSNCVWCNLNNPIINNVSLVIFVSDSICVNGTINGPYDSSICNTFFWGQCGMSGTVLDTKYSYTIIATVCCVIVALFTLSAVICCYRRCRCPCCDCNSDNEDIVVEMKPKSKKEKPKIAGESQNYWDTGKSIHKESNGNQRKPLQQANSDDLVLSMDNSASVKSLSDSSEEVAQNNLNSDVSIVGASAPLSSMTPSVASTYQAHQMEISISSVNPIKTSVKNLSSSSDTDDDDDISENVVPLTPPPRDVIDIPTKSKSELDEIPPTPEGPPPPVDTSDSDISQ